MKLNFSFQNLLSVPDADTGISLRDFENALPEAEKAYKKFLQEVASNELGFYYLPDFDTKKITNFVNEASKEYDTMVVLGIGGSALGSRAVYDALKTTKSLINKILVCDNVDPIQLYEILEQIELKRTLFNVITKSGGTAETMSQFLIIHKILRDAYQADYRKHLIITTDAEKGFMRRVTEWENLPSFTVPDNVGGRFSVLTDVSLVPLAFAGVNINGLLKGAGAMRERCNTTDFMKNPAMMLALSHVLLFRKGYNISVMMPYSNTLVNLADWYRQLWGESLGKKLDNDGKVIRTGQTPAKSLGTTDQHSQVQLYVEGPHDKIVTFLRVEEFKYDYTIPNVYPDELSTNFLADCKLSELLNTEQLATEIALTDAGCPNCTITFPALDEYHLGEFIYLFEMATVLAGYLLNIDPLNQPGVEAGKIATYALMGHPKYTEHQQKVKKYKQERNAEYII
ncbi:MAG: glucose-6-phosphate isomerase [Candidatus Cloacimonetes bacterium]|nr:glucose-6-phosphate isomerase [Candidatus Cloacimonadota bacterium]